MTIQVTADQLRVFGSLFVGRRDVYGTYNLSNKRVWQVKEPVTEDVLTAHLNGVRPCGIYPLVRDTIRMAAVDFDVDDQTLPAGFVSRLCDLGLPAYLERSKSKGHHVWLFFDAPGARARVVRTVLRGVLEDMRQPQVEIFPKQDVVGEGTAYGNFINLPLFGGLVAERRAVFLNSGFQPHPDQWAFLAGITRIDGVQIDRIAQKWQSKTDEGDDAVGRKGNAGSVHVTHALRPCAQRMLTEGVTVNQRLACFRLACQLRKAGLPHKYALAILNLWSQRNRPTSGKAIISADEIAYQTRCAYQGRLYSSCGCCDASVMPFCSLDCPIRKRRGAVSANMGTSEQPSNPQGHDT